MNVALLRQHGNDVARVLEVLHGQEVSASQPRHGDGAQGGMAQEQARATHETRHTLPEETRPAAGSYNTMDIGAGTNNWNSM